jgi:thioredoxin 1
MQNNSIVELSEAEYLGFVSSSNLVVVDWFATWCLPCGRMLKILPNLANQFTGKALFAKVDIDLNESMAETLEITSVPTFIIYKNGEEVERWEGIKTLLEMSRIIQTHV